MNSALDIVHRILICSDTHTHTHTTHTHTSTTHTHHFVVTRD